MPSQAPGMPVGNEQAMVIRSMLDRAGVPLTPENYNRASLSLAQNQPNSDWDMTAVADVPLQGNGGLPSAGGRRGGALGQQVSVGPTARPAASRPGAAQGVGAEHGAGQQSAAMAPKPMLPASYQTDPGSMMGAQGPTEIDPALVGAALAMMPGNMMPNGEPAIGGYQSDTGAPTAPGQQLPVDDAPPSAPPPAAGSDGGGATRSISQRLFGADTMGGMTMPDGSPMPVNPRVMAGSVLASVPPIKLMELSQFFSNAAARAMGGGTTAPAGGVGAGAPVPGATSPAGPGPAAMPPMSAPSSGMGPPPPYRPVSMSQPPPAAGPPPLAGGPLNATDADVGAILSGAGRPQLPPGAGAQVPAVIPRPAGPPPTGGGQKLLSGPPDMQGIIRGGRTELPPGWEGAVTSNANRGQPLQLTGPKSAGAPPAASPAPPPAARTARGKGTPNNTDAAIAERKATHNEVARRTVEARRRRKANN